MTHFVLLGSSAPLHNIVEISTLSVFSFYTLNQDQKHGDAIYFY